MLAAYEWETVSQITRRPIIVPIDFRPRGAEETMLANNIPFSGQAIRCRVTLSGNEYLTPFFPLIWPAPPPHILYVSYQKGVSGSFENEDIAEVYFYKAPLLLQLTTRVHFV